MINETDNPLSARNGRRSRRWLWLVTVLLVGGGGLAVAAIIDMTIEDFHLSGTQVSDVGPEIIQTSHTCSVCHGGYDPDNEPFFTWAGSLMGLAGRDPLFFAQMTTANQDVANVGYFCMRCHVPLSFVTGHAYDTDGSTLDDTDRDGVNCHFCHSMLDPIYRPGESPPEDEAILAGMDEVPEHYGNAMFVLDPTGLRRGPYEKTEAPHEAVYSPFHKAGRMCGTCHDVGNVAVDRLPDGTYTYNTIDERTPDENPHAQFPLERTFSEWALSEFATPGVDMGGRFGGEGVRVVSTCQDCHMPKTTGQGCSSGPPRSDLARHTFAGAAAPVLDLIAEHYKDDPNVDLDAIAAGRANAVSMLERAASLSVRVEEGLLRVQVTNESGHKLPTGHIEGRRVWLNVRLLNSTGALLREFGHYDYDEAHLDEESTTIFEMKVGLSEAAAEITGLPPGVTTHMALADLIVKDNRIPPRGFENATFEAAGAPVVGETYADGEYWHWSEFPMPPGAARAEVTLYYQSLTRHYIEALRDGNVTDDWGEILHSLWRVTGRGAPIPMATASWSSIFSDGFESGDTDAWSMTVP